jgi:hypothetical protein
MNVAIVGNHNMMLTPEIVSKMASFLVVLSEEPAWGKNGVSIRAAREGSSSSPVEASAYSLAATLGLECYQVRPMGSGRASVFDRDYTLVESVDRVVAFFRFDRIMEGGTGHVVHAALVKGIPVEAWVLNEDGTLDGVGSDDGLEVDTEGSRWMQLRFMEWQAGEVERQLQEPLPWTPSELLTTTAAPKTYAGTITGSATTSIGTFQFTNGKVYLSESTNHSASRSWPASPNLSFTEPPSGSTP